MWERALRERFLYLDTFAPSISLAFSLRVVKERTIADGKHATTATTRIHNIKEPIMRAIFGLFLLILVGGSLTGCVIEEPGGWHHHHYDHD